MTNSVHRKLFPGFRRNEQNRYLCDLLIFTNDTDIENCADNNKKILLKNIMARFFEWGSTASRLQSHYEETVYFLTLTPEKFQVLI